MKIDVFTHIMPEKYVSTYRKLNPGIETQPEVTTPAMVDLDVRFRLMDRYPDVLQVLTVGNVPLEIWVGPGEAVELARIANEEVAELVVKYPNRFFAGVACLPMNDVDAALEEADRAITQLRLKGVQIFSHVKGETLDSPKFRPLYEKMAQYDLPIWIHPARNDALYDDIGIFTWPFETSSAMYRLVQSGVFVDYPNIKFIVHHAGAMAPFFANRIKWALTYRQQRYPNLHEHFRKFYGDTALYGYTSGLMCAYDYFGADHLLLGSDAPLGPRSGGMVEDTIESVERMAIADVEKQKILKGNAVDLLRLAL